MLKSRDESSFLSSSNYSISKINFKITRENKNYSKFARLIIYLISFNKLQENKNKIKIYNILENTKNI